MTRNPCKAIHNHPHPSRAFDGFAHEDWILALERIGDGIELNKRCGGALRLRDVDT